MTKSRSVLRKRTKPIRNVYEADEIKVNTCPHCHAVSMELIGGVYDGFIRYKCIHALSGDLFVRLNKRIKAAAKKRGRGKKAGG
jgi:hypothetical protein